MTWSHPASLLGIWLVVAVALLEYYMYGKRRQLSKKLVADSMSDLLPGRSMRRFIVRLLLLVSGTTFLWIALAGPRFGVTYEKVQRRGTDLLVLLDSSRSMLAEDVAPNRLTGAKLDIEDLLQNVVGDRIGLIAFAGKPIIVAPLTTDYSFFREQLQKIDTDSAPQGGTAIGDAIRLALRLLPDDPNRDKAIILITDGEDHESMPIEATHDAAAREVRLFTVAVGDFQEGARIPLFDNIGKKVGYEKYQDQEIWSKADNNLLKEIATITKGMFIPAGISSYDLGAIYRHQLEQLHRFDDREQEQKVLLLQYQLFLLPGMILLALYWAIPDYSRKPAAISDFKKIIKKNATVSIFWALFLVIPITVVGEEATHKQTALQQYNQACRLAEQGDVAGAEKIFRELSLLINSKIAARANLNLGLLLAREAMNPPKEDAKDMLEEVTAESLESPVPKNNPITEYETQRTQRSAELLPIFEKLEEAKEHFIAALFSKETRKEAQQNIDVITTWKNQEIARFNEKERSIRNDQFSFTDYLQWLENKQREIDDRWMKQPNEIDSAGYQDWHETTDIIRDFSDDFNLLHQKYEDFKSQLDPAQRPDEANDILPELIRSTGEQTQRSASTLAEFDQVKSNEELRKSISGLNAVSSLFISYPDLVLGSVAFQEESLKANRFDSNSPDLNRDKLLSKIFWNDQVVERWTNLMIQHSQAVKNYPEEDADEVEVEAIPTDTPQRSPEERIRESMQLALKLGPEIIDEIVSIREMGNSIATEELFPKEEKIRDLLKEIAKPLEEDNQNQDQNSNQDQKSETEQQDNQEQGDREEPPEDSKENQSQDQPKEEEKESSEPPKESSEQEEQSLMRKIRQRQQEAQEVRKAIDQIMRKTEKTDKNW